MSGAKQTFLKSIAWVMLLNIIVKPLYIFGIDRTVQNTVGPEAYGLYYALFNLTFLFHIVLDLGLTNFHNKSVSQQPQRLQRRFGYIFTGKILLSLFYFALTFLAAYFLNYDREHYYLILLLGINQFLVSLLFYVRANIAGMQWFRWDSVMSVLDRSIMIVVCGYLLFGSSLSDDFTLLWFVYAQMGAYALSVMLGIGLLVAKSQKLQWQFSRRHFAAAVKKSWPYALVVLFMTIYHRTDAIMIERILPNGAEESGYYAQSYRILEAFQIVSFLFVGILYPLIGRLISQKTDINPTISVALRLLLILGITMFFISYFTGNETLVLLYSELDSRSVLVFQLLMLSFIPLVFVDIYGTVLTAGNHLFTFNIITGAGVLLNIVLNVYLIPTYEITGAALATLATLILVGLSSTIIAIRKYHLFIDYRASVRLIVISVIAFASIWLTINYMNSLVLSWALIVIIVTVLSFGLRFLDVKDAMELIRNSKK